ncbi:MAG: hypothetical protein Q9173_004923 [Seirophora scorigena]
MSERTLSKRGQENLPAGEAFEKFIEVLTNTYDKEMLPSISLGVAENGLMHEELASFYSKLNITPRLLTYGDGPSGSRALRTALSSFFNDYFKPIEKVLPEQLVVAGGVTSIIDLIVFAVADEGDGILIGRPLYTSFANDIKSRAGAKLCPVSSDGRDPMSEGMVEQFQKELVKREKEGTRVRAIILASPHNPLGKCYVRVPPAKVHPSHHSSLTKPSPQAQSVETLKAYMRFCQRHGIHFISDEIYAMSIYHTPTNTSATPFTSVLAIDTSNLIDANLVHVLYGMSKDFSSNGLRAGVLLSQRNPSVIRTLKSIAMFSWPASVTEHYWTALLDNRAFLDGYFAENSRRLAAGHARLTGFLQSQGVRWVEGSNAGFFVWVDFRALLGGDIVVADEGKEEMEVEAVAVGRPSQVYRTSRKAKARDGWFFEKMIKAKVFVASGNAFFAEEHGCGPEYAT